VSKIPLRSIGSPVTARVGVDIGAGA